MHVVYANIHCSWFLKLQALIIYLHHKSISKSLNDDTVFHYQLPKVSGSLSTDLSELWSVNSNSAVMEIIIIIVQY